MAGQAPVAEEAVAGEQRRQPRPLTLNLGCGADHRPNELNVDSDPGVDPDTVVDLQATPWPWETDAFERVRARHVLEHLDPVPWSEIVRVLAPDGEFILTYPFGHTRFEDPTHEQFWNYHTAAALAGERAHGHSAPLAAFDLIDHGATWWLSDGGWLANAAVGWLVGRRGVGPWLEAVPGVYGEVRAVYRA